MLFLTKKHVVIQIFLITIILSSLISCKDKAQTHLLQENVIRLAQQNGFIKKENQLLRSAIESLTTNSQYRETKDLDTPADRFYQNADSFLEQITMVQKRAHRANANHLFKYYISFQKAFQQIKNNLTLDNNINGFMNLDEKSFIAKYFSISDSLAQLSQLLILESDALINYNACLRTIHNYYTPFCGFDDHMAIAITDKCIYKRGERLKVTALVAQYNRVLQGDAIIDGQKVKVKDGVFFYSRRVTESPGSYDVPVSITWLNENNEEQTYPARVVFQVE